MEVDSNVETEAFRNSQRLKELRIEHRRLDEEIAALALEPGADQIQIRRLKRRKLAIKDIITHLESDLIPDLNA
ncbi:MAG TPA: YdcH family protein [Gammaproteobacteria bacterium]|nr:YdcH family protein [Gammaproteobacteria bacterium]